MKEVYISKETLESVQKLKSQSQEIVKKFAPLILKMNKLSLKFVKLSFQWQENRKIYVQDMAEQGWFPSWNTFYDNSIEVEKLDDTMILHIDNFWDDIKLEIKRLCPNREHILDVIFKLHEEKNYIASIPLIFSQADGIANEEYAQFFSGQIKASQKILDEVENKNLKVDFLTLALLEPFKMKLQVSNKSSKSSNNYKRKGPNRHGILHGSRKHLDYGTKINGYKAFSFLAFLVYTMKDEFKKNSKVVE